LEFLYTIGEAVLIRIFFRIRLGTRFFKNEMVMLFEEPKIIAKTGWTTDDLSCEN
jgi:hypothetical protein